jgi:hypothetical protein
VDATRATAEWNRVATGATAEPAAPATAEAPVADQDHIGRIRSALRELNVAAHRRQLDADPTTLSRIRCALEASDALEASTRQRRRRDGDGGMSW